MRVEDQRVGCGSNLAFRMDFKSSRICLAPPARRGATQSVMNSRMCHQFLWISPTPYFNCSAMLEMQDIRKPCSTFIMKSTPLGDWITMEPWNSDPQLATQ